jgi:hypothetical protein
MTTDRRFLDYPALRHQFVVGDLTIRALCRENGIDRSWSTVARRAKEEDWERKRAQFRSLEEAKTYEMVAEKRAHLIAQIGEDLLTAIQGSVLKFLDGLEGKWVNDPVSGTRQYVPGITVNPSDLAKMIDKFQLLAGGATSREEHLGINLHGDLADLPAELLRELSAVARAKGAGSGPMGQSPVPRLEGARQVN